VVSKPIACIVGWPVKHSRSPVIHRYWLNEYGIEGDYVLHPVEPENIAAFFANFATSGFVGCNVTVPHKEAAYAAVARRDAAAKESGALNTLWLEDGVLVGASTDPVGFLSNLDEEVPGWDENKGAAVVLGAGGSARAIVWGLLQRGFAPVYVVNRDAARPKALAKLFGDRVKPAAWADVPSLLITARVLVNTTTLGMTGQPPLKIDLAPLPKDAVVNDIVYVPSVTGLIAAARARNLRVAGGLGMLLHQAVPGFEHWFGRRPEVTPALRAAVQKSIDES
jgi:shikimate dehydrogenase